MGDTVHLKGEGGVVWEFEEPLPEWVQNQVERGLLHPADETDAESDNELDALRAEYKDLFGEAPHHAKKAETLRKEIDAKLTEE